MKRKHLSFSCSKIHAVEEINIAMTEAQRELKPLSSTFFYVLPMLIDLGLDLQAQFSDINERSINIAYPIEQNDYICFGFELNVL